MRSYLKNMNSLSKENKNETKSYSYQKYRDANTDFSIYVSRRKDVNISDS